MFLLFFALVQDRDTLSLKLEDTENWLYEDGEDQPKQVYIDKLDELKVTVSVWLCDAGFKHTWCITTTVLKLFCPVYRNWANPFKTDTQRTRSGQKLLMSWENSFSSTWKLWRPSRWRLVLILLQSCVSILFSPWINTFVSPWRRSSMSIWRRLIFKKLIKWWVKLWSGWTAKWTSRANSVSPWIQWWKLQRLQQKRGWVFTIHFKQ